VLVVVAAAILPYLSTLDNYYVRDDFGVVHLLSRKPWDSLPGWFASSWMDSIWGFTADEIRPFPALSYQWVGPWGWAWDWPSSSLSVLSDTTDFALYDAARSLETHQSQEELDRMIEDISTRLVARHPLTQ